MIKQCCVCNKVYETPLRHFINQVPRVCSLLCFKVLLEDSSPEIKGLETPQPWVTSEEFSKPYFRSAMEHEVAIKFKKNGIDWIYEPYYFRLRNGDIYLPDFYLPKYNCLIEVKGLLDVRGKRKIKGFIETYPQYKFYLIDQEAFKLIIKKGNNKLFHRTHTRYASQWK